MDKPEDSIRDAAMTLNDKELSAKLGGIDLKAKEVKYHHSCRKAYTNKAKRLNDQSTNQLPRTSAHQEAFEQLRPYIQMTLIES